MGNKRTIYPLVGNERLGHFLVPDMEASLFTVVLLIATKTLSFLFNERKETGKIITLTMDRNVYGTSTRLAFLLVACTAVAVSCFTFVSLQRNRGSKRHETTVVSAMKKIPPGFQKYSQVPRSGVFTATTIPRGLLNEHSTKAGTWGVIRVFRGKLLYNIKEPAPSTLVLDADTPGIIESQMKHDVAPLTEDLEFVVEFYRLPNTGPVDEQREGL